MTDQNRKDQGWKFVSELRSDGTCCPADDSEDEVPSLSSDDGNGSINSEEQAKTMTGAAPDDHHVPAGGHENSLLPLDRYVPTSQSRPKASRQGNHWPSTTNQRTSQSFQSLNIPRGGIQPSFDPSQATPRTQRGIDTGSLRQVLSEDRIADGIQFCEKPGHRARALGSGILSTALNHNSQDEVRAPDNQKMREKQNTLPGVEYRHFEVHEETDNSDGLDMSAKEYIW